MFKKLNRRDIIIGFILAGLLAFFMRDLAIPGLPMFHDSNPHISRAIAYHNALADGQYPPMWAKEVLGGIGSPVLMLNYQLPYMLGELWVRLGTTIFDSYKLTLGITYLFSGIFMYFALRTRYSRVASWVGALVYCLAPYRMVDIYVRGALGEAMSFMFPPLLIWGYSKGIKPLLVVGWSGLFLTHPVASAAFSAFFLGYTMVMKKKFEWGSYIIAVLIAAFNILPTLAYTKYTYYSPSLSDTLLMFPSLGQMINSPWGYGVSLTGLTDGMSFALGISAWVILIVGIIWAGVKKNIELGYLGASVILAIAIILPIAKPLYELGLGRIIDFPWRLILCVVFGTAWMGASVISNLKWQISNIVVVIITCTLVWQTIPIAHTNRYWESHHDLEFFARETGDSYGEYAPRTRETRDSAPFGKRAEIVTGSGEIRTLIEQSNRQKYEVSMTTLGMVRINTAYFPGWKIPENCEVTKRTLEHIDDSGLIQCSVDSGEQILEIVYEAPTVQRIASMLTLAGIGGFIWILLVSFYPRLMSAKR